MAISAKKAFRFAPAAIIAALTVLAYTHRFVQDDAFISFRYAENLVRGHGLVWNPGERIEGFSNFLWTLLIAGGFALGADPVLTSTVLGLTCFVVALSATYSLATSLTDDRLRGMLATIVLGTNYSYSAYATGGLETQMQAACITGAFALWASWTGAQRFSPMRLALLSTVFAVGVWVRFDSFLPVAVLGGGVMATCVGPTQARGRRLRSILALSLPFLGLVGGLFVFKWAYFGSILPNSFYAKFPDTSYWRMGLAYVSVFLASYRWEPLAAAVIFAAWPALRERNGTALCAAALVIAWTVYVVRVGGDFMEFRLLVPVLPVAVCLVVFALKRFGRAWTVGVALYAAIFSFNFRNASAMPGMLIPGVVENIAYLRSHLEDPNQGWRDVGEALGREFAAIPDVTIAVVAAGAIPYYSKLKTVDMIGLNNPWVALHGEPFWKHPSHARVASARYLLSRRVNFVVHPFIPGIEELDSQYTLSDIHQRFVRLRPRKILPKRARIVEIPIKNGRMLRVLYLVRTPELDRLIVARGFRTWPIARMRSAG